MSRCTIIIEDVEGESGAEFRLEVNYGLNFVEASHAHRFAAVLLLAADRLAENLGHEETIEGMPD